MVSTIFLVVYLKPLLSKLNTSFLQMEQERSALINEFNQNEELAISFVNRRHKDISDFRGNLVKADGYTSQALNITEELIAHDELLSQLAKYRSKSMLVQSYLEEDNLKQAHIKEYALKINGRIKIIDYYYQVKNLTTCIKQISNNKTLNDCQSFNVEGIILFINDSQYPKKLNYFLNNYFELTSSEKVRRLNELINLHNKAVDELERQINAPI
ncbi:hypothetical protein IT417_00915 [bacterium]|nr:hypothetical protein [bacterium]